jgi:hypothetical protein
VAEAVCSTTHLATKVMRKTDFSGNFQRPNLTMREDLGAKSFSQTLISNGLQIICKVSGKIYTPMGYRGGGVSLRYKPGGLLTEQTGRIPDRLSRGGGCASSFLHCACGEENDLQVGRKYCIPAFRLRFVVSQGLKSRPEPTAIWVSQTWTTRRTHARAR